MDWYRVDRPEWYVGEGWALTPEAAGVADADRRGPSLAPIDRLDLDSASCWRRLMIGGRSFDPTLRPRLTVRLDGRRLIDDRLAPGAFLRVRVACRSLSATAAIARLRRGDGGSERRLGAVAIEQFDALDDAPADRFRRRAGTSRSSTRRTGRAGAG